MIQVTVNKDINKMTIEDDSMENSSSEDFYFEEVDEEEEDIMKSIPKQVKRESYFTDEDGTGLLRYYKTRAKGYAERNGIKEWKILKGKYLFYKVSYIRGSEKFTKKFLVSLEDGADFKIVKSEEIAFDPEYLKNNIDFKFMRKEMYDYV